ncbi:unnamed protein product [Mytilus coruscus]|uniref:Uncharacterized protein n=1 Tax=Mytilus coruscus TaxID=42192 RepID=A0A6J8AH80_MYTCO|nr:unnamed protein product [Mytilus coruscus]
MDEEIKRPAKRKALEKSPESLHVALPRWVSDWKRSDLSLLHIYYADDFLDEPFDVLSKIPTLGVELNRCQKEYIQEANHFLKFEASVEKLQLHGSLIKSSISELYVELEKQPEKLVNFNVKRFIMALDRLLEDVQHAFQSFKPYEGLFTQFVGAFAELCCLESLNCGKVQETTWHNLANCTVISEPDLRFFKCGLEQRKTNSMVTVLESSGNSRHSRSRNQEIKNTIKVKKVRKRSRELSPDAYFLNDSSSSSSGSCSWLTVGEQEADRPLIERIANTRVLGQHGGELLLDLKRYQESTTESELTMPGMIIDQTKVIFTLLVMSRTHLDKLKNNHLLQNDDRAVIFYSKPLDILSEESRSILIENFMRLNNV